MRNDNDRGNGKFLSRNEVRSLLDREFDTIVEYKNWLLIRGKNESFRSDMWFLYHKSCDYIPGHGSTQCQICLKHPDIHIVITYNWLFKENEH